MSAPGRSMPQATAPAKRPSARPGAFVDDAELDAHEHGEQRDDGPREDLLIGTAGSHTPRTDTRAEEPYGELAASADTEGGID
jgi:hypothetical protein